MWARTHRAVVISPPSHVCDVRCVDRSTKEEVSEGRRYSVRCPWAGPMARFGITAILAPLEEGAPCSGAAPQDAFDRLKGRSQKAMLVSHLVQATVNHPLGGNVCLNAITM